MMKYLPQAETTRFRTAIPVEQKQAAFLMAASTCTYRRIESQFSMDPSIVLYCIRGVPCAIRKMFSDALTLPCGLGEIVKITSDLQRVAGIPYRVGGADETHFKWTR